MSQTVKKYFVLTSLIHTTKELTKCLSRPYLFRNSIVNLSYKKVTVQDEQRNHPPFQDMRHLQGTRCSELSKIVFGLIQLMIFSKLCI